jgi:nucleoside 2-deoxyribosyltransferase
MNLLRKTRVYSAGPMEFVQDGETWRDKCDAFLSNLGVICFNPYKRPFESDIKEDKESQRMMREWREDGLLWKVHEHMKEIIASDLAMVDRADFIIAYVNPDVPTFGTMHEIVAANQQKKPIFVCVEGGVEKTPLWLLGLLPVRFFYNNFDELLEMIRKIDAGEVKIDSNRWRLFKEEYR